jgi:hypothetical protein
MCDLCFVPRCDCEAALAGSQDIAPVAAGGGAVRANPAPTVTDVLALDSTQHWTGGTVSYGFPDTAAGITGKTSYYSPYNEPGSLLTLSKFGRDSLRDGFAQWDAVTTLNITEAASGTMAEINVGGSSVPSTAWAYFPGSQRANGDIWFNTGEWFLDALAGAPEPIIGSYAYATGMHEFGHALGLKHPHQISGRGTAVLDPEYDWIEFSIMSYRSHPGGPTGAYTLESWGYPQSPMMLDIAMIQRIYGADYGTLSGDTTYTVSTTTGEMFVDGVSLGTPGGNRVFRTLWDGNGTDHIDLSDYTTNMHADLNPGRGIRFDTDGDFQAAKLASGIHAGFNIYMSMLHEGDTRSLIENLTTGSGDDILIGNAADNVLDGGGGVNTVIYAGNAADYVIDLGGGRVIGAATGTDTLINIARIQFDDRVLTLPDTVAPVFPVVPVVDAVDSVDVPVVPVKDPVEDPVTPPPPQFRVSDTGYDLVEFAADEQGTGPAEIGPDGRSVTMAGDDWKAVEGSFTITADTVLRFTYAADVEGEIHGIGFANADATVDLMPERGGTGALFQLGGVTRDWGIENAAWDYAFGSGEATFEIAVGKYLEGTFDRMVFVMDDDAGRGSSATFADVEMWQVPPTTGQTTATQDDILAAANVDATQTLSQLSAGDMFDWI